MQIEFIVMVFVGAVREEHFLLYSDVLTKIIPWFFATDHTNYSRWIPIHLHDMTILESKLPGVYADFMEGNFTV